MILNYKTVYSFTEPTLIEVTPYVVYIRKDISSEERTREDGIGYAVYTYQEAALTPDEYEVYKTLQNSEKSENVNDNQLIIMEAIADLYDMIANKE